MLHTWEQWMAHHLPWDRWWFSLPRPTRLRWWRRIFFAAFAVGLVLHRFL